MNIFKTIIKNKDRLKKISDIIFPLISLMIILYFCIKNNNISKLCEAFPNLNFLWIIVAIASLILTLYFDGKCLKELFKYMNYRNFREIFFFKISFLGQYFTALTPMGIGSKAIQVLKFKEAGIPEHISIMILTRKLMVYQICLTIISLISGALYYSELFVIYPEFIVWFIVGIISQSFMVGLLFISLANKKFTLKISNFIIFTLNKLKVIKNYSRINCSINEKIETLITQNKSFSKNKIFNLKIYALNFLQIIFTFLIPFFIFKSFNYQCLPLLKSFCTQSVITTISSFTPLPGASGTYESSFLKFFSLLIPSTKIAAIMILYRLISFYLILIFGTIFYKKSTKH